MAKGFTRKTRQNRETNKTKEVETIDTSVTDTTVAEGIEETSGTREAQGETTAQVDINLEQVPRRRKKRKVVEAKPEKVSEDVADMVINLLNIVGGSISDEGQVNELEAHLIKTGITNMPTSEKLTKALEKVYPLAGIVGLVGWGTRTFTHRRKKEEVAAIEVKPVIDDAIKSAPIQPTLIDFDGGANVA